MKKLISYFLVFLFVFTSVFGFSSKKVFAVRDYEVHVTVFCDNTILAKNYVRQLCRCNFDGQRERFIEDQTTGSDTQTVIVSDFAATRYHTHFHVVDAGWALSPSQALNDLIRICTGAIILYDISDPRLLPIIRNPTFYPEDVERLLKIEMPLNNCIRYLRTLNWYDAIYSITYGKEGLGQSEYDQYHESMNRYTCGLEPRHNKWGRGNSDISTERSLTNSLGWLDGEAYRSIFLERILTGDIGMMSKKKWISWIFQCCWGRDQR